MLLIRNRKDPRKKKGNDQRIPLLDISGYDACRIIEEQGRFSNIREGRIFPYNGRGNGGLTAAWSCTAVSRSFEKQRKTEKAPPRSADWIAARSGKQCADNPLQAKRRANEVRFILRLSRP